MAVRPYSIRCIARIIPSMPAPRKTLRRVLPPGVRRRLYDAGLGRRKRWARYPGLEAAPGAGAIAITFDDGPDEDATPAVLAALADAGSLATFFVTGEQADARPDLLRRLVTEGHEIGLHGFRHLRLDGVPSGESEADVLRGYESLCSKIDAPVRWFRPPYGRMSAGAARACDALGLSVVYWSAWGHDWEEISAGGIFEVAEPGLRDGAILLLHDSARYAVRKTALPTATAIPMLAGAAAARGLRLGTVGSVCAKGRT